MSQPPYTYRALVESVVDGDTIHATIDLGFGVLLRGTTSTRPGIVLRLAGINARELGEPGGREARANLQQLVQGVQVLVTTVLVDKYGGRYDAHVTLPDGRDLSSLLVTSGWATPWDGVGVPPLPDWPRVAAS